MDVDKITAIAALLETGKRHEEANEQRDAVRAYAEAYQGMQESLVEVHTLWVEAYKELTRQTGPEFESTIPFSAQGSTDDEAAEADAIEAAVTPVATVSDPAKTEETPVEESFLDVAESEDITNEEPAEPYKILQVAKDDVHEDGLLFKATRSNPFTQAAKDLAAAVVEAASDVAAAVVDVRRGKTAAETDVTNMGVEAETENGIGAEQNRETEDQFVSEASDESSAQAPELNVNVYEQSSADHKLVVLESLLQQVRSRKNP